MSASVIHLHRLAYFLLVFLVVCPTVRAEVDFNRQIRPILAEYCFHCHGPDAGQRAADLRLDLEHEAKASGVISQRAQESELIQRILATDADTVMPPPETGKVLSGTQKLLMSQWIDQGAKYATHWAFQPIRPASTLLPVVSPHTPPDMQPIDYFLAQKLAKVGLAFSPEINRYQFVRRATFDLTGLPPTWPEVVAFVEDQEPGYVERLIDRLLDSPRYGERWGRHWLDIARYADTHGGAAIGFTTFPFSYTYRDYVIRAMNEDLPFDRFLLEQIAADQLTAGQNDASLAAVGFLTVGMQFRSYHDTIDDQIDVVTRGLMGLTVSCARCHDHKFDPISTEDYYSLYAAIAPSRGPSELPTIGKAVSENAQETYQEQLASLTERLDSFVRDQSEIMRSRLRMQVGLYLAEIAKGTPEQDVSTEFLSYRTDDLRPLILNRWLAYLERLSVHDPVFGPWIEMQAWASESANDFSKRSEVYLQQLKSELEEAGTTIEKLHALRGELPKWNPLMLDALQAAKPASLSEVTAVYGKVFAEESRLWLHALIAASEEAGSPNAVLPDDHPQHQVINSPVHRQLRQHLYSPGTPFDLTDKESLHLTNRTINDLINAKSNAIHDLNLASPGSPPRAMILVEDPQPRNSYVFVRGDPLVRGNRVEPKFLSILSQDKPRVFENGKRRLGLAQSVIAKDNPLTCRVLVNWAWQNHFGYGLVRTPDDFGSRGSPPTHPELLDYLADELRANGWSMKWLHRQIMLSRAYRQAAVEHEASRRVDPENELLWRMPRQRLDFEAMRDAMLVASEELDVTMGGRPVDLNATPTVPRRSVYGFVNRDIIANLMSTFDTANPNACTAKRPETTVPQQTLFALNSDFIQDRAQQIAELSRKTSPSTREDRIVIMFRQILGRDPTITDFDKADRFIADAVDAADLEKKWCQLAHVLLASNEFMFLD